MTWFKVDDGFYDHPKVVALQDNPHWPLCLSLWLLGGSYSARQLTDGFVPMGQLRRMAIGMSHEQVEEVITILVHNELWREEGAGIRFCDWSDYQPTRQDVLDKRKTERDRKAEWRRNKLKKNNENETDLSRWDNTDRPDGTNASVLDLSRSPRPVPSRPVPTRPVPTKVKEKDLQRGKPAASKSNGVTNETWEAYSAAYQQRYGAKPRRNSSVNGKLVQFIQRVGINDAPHIAAYFVRMNTGWYVQKKHQVGLMLQDAEKLATEWETNTQTTNTEARRSDRRQSLVNSFAPLLAEAEKNEQ